jgi:hypothetical protein
MKGEEVSGGRQTAKRAGVDGCILEQGWFSGHTEMNFSWDSSLPVLVSHEGSWIHSEEKGQSVRGGVGGLSGVTTE